MALAEGVGVVAAQSGAGLGLGEALRQAGGGAWAVAEYRLAEALDATNIDACNGLGVALSLTGERQSAENDDLDGLERGPDHLALRNNLAMSLALGTVIPGFLSEVAAFEPLPLAGVTVTLSVVALLASYLPAWRASRIDPVEALRPD